MRVWPRTLRGNSAEHVYKYIYIYENDENSVLKPPAVNTISAAYYIQILDLRIFSVRVRNSIPLMCIIYTYIIIQVVAQTPQHCSSAAVVYFRLRHKYGYI